MGYIDDVQRKYTKGGGYDLTTISGRSAAAELDIAFGSAIVAGEFDQDNNYEASASSAVHDNAALKVGGQFRFLGVSHRTLMHGASNDGSGLSAPYGDGDTVYTKKGEALSIQTQGRIAVLVTEDVLKTDPVVFNSNATDNLDTWSKTPANGQAVPTAKWFQGAKAGELAILELNGV